jgi:hypothetical protein
MGAQVKENKGVEFTVWLCKGSRACNAEGECGQPTGGKHDRKKHGKYKICDERFYSYWVPGLVELILQDWF